MWIAACDDDYDFVKSLEKNLKSICLPDDMITVYTSGMGLLDAACGSAVPIDLVFLDIEMPGISGIESGHELRTISPGTVIVILTRFVQYALKCYEIRAFQYLMKPVTAQKLQEIVGEVRVKQECMAKSTLYIKTRDEEIYLPLAEILYIESFRRSLILYTSGNTYKMNRNISHLSVELENIGFFRLHKSYIVNLSHVRRVDKRALKAVLVNGEELPVSDKKMSGLANSLLDVRRAAHDII